MSSVNRDDERLERIDLALTWVPLSHYDTVQKRAEQAVASFIEERDAARALLRRISEWDALHPTVVAPYGDAPYWLSEIAKVLDGDTETAPIAEGRLPRLEARACHGSRTAADI